MSESNEQKGVPAIALVGAALAVFVLFVLLYALPRHRANQDLEKEIQALIDAQQEVALLVPELKRTERNLPEPAPDVRSWVASNALAGLEKNLVKNDSGNRGKLADLKLRAMKPQQVGQFLSQLTRVNLVLERMSLSDFDADGRWDIEAQVKVPGP